LETSDKITQLENEIKVLKNEVQAVLLDIRENVLNAENPFTAPKPAVANQQPVIEPPVQPVILQPVNEPKSTPAPAPTVIPPAQEQKPVNSVQTSEIPANETPETGQKSNGRKRVETYETDKKTNNRKAPDIIQEDSPQTEQFETEPPRFELGDSQSHKGQPNLVAYASLVCWVENSTRRLGRERTQVLLDISEASGFLPHDVKAILTKLTTIKSTENSYKPTARDYFDSLAKIAAIFGNNSDYNAALLLVLAQGDVHG
jgi:hypothetical protein